MNKPAILCIDDEKIVLDSLRDQLKNHFKDTIILEFGQSAQEGLEILEEFKEDGVDIRIILSDWHMPEMSGDDFLFSIHPAYPNIKKVLLSGEPDPNIILKAKSKDIAKLIQKPWDSKELISLIKSYLE
jgi:response regulator RpfG family c-di-GMP phosphodiesterase